MDKILNEYFDYLANVKKSSVNTINSYKSDIYAFVEFIKENNIELTSSGTGTVLNYLMHIQQNGKSATSATRALAALRSLFKYMAYKKYIDSDPTFNIHGFKSDKKLPQSLSDIQVEALLDQPKCRNIKGYRDKAILEVMYATGMRASDIIRLQLKDINLSIGCIYCRGKNKERIIPIYSLARDCLRDYIEKRRLIKNSDNTDFLFLNLSGSPLTRQGLWKIIKHYQKESGIDVEITPHTLRHSFAIHLLENGADIKSVQEMLGHSDISSTLVYEQIVNNKLTEVYGKAHPRASKK